MPTEWLKISSCCTKELVREGMTFVHALSSESQQALTRSQCVLRALIGELTVGQCCRQVPLRDKYVTTRCDDSNDSRTLSSQTLLSTAEIVL